MKIEAVALKNGENLTFGDFNVFIGGNGVGKTTVISEIFHKISDLSRSKWLWIDRITHHSANVGNDMRLLKTSLGRKYEGNTTSLFYYSNAIKGVEGNIDLGDTLRFSREEYQAMDNIENIALFNEARYRRPFLSFSSCESRLSLVNDVALTSLESPPSDPINVLYRNKTLLNKIDKSTIDIFKYHFVLLDHSRSKLVLGLSKELPPTFNSATQDLQDEYEKIEAWKGDKFVPLTEAGHGIRSMIRLLTSLLEPVNQVILIDEPEMHLYPSQKRWLGKQLVNLAKTQGKQVFLVTHDPMILQGILDASTRTHIFRVERNDTDQGVIKVCELDRITDATALRNQEQYLQGLFYQRCIVVEGASDRSFYQNMLEDFSETQDKDLGVVVAGGKGSSKHMAHIVAKVGLKAAFVYDFDILIDSPSLIRDIYQTLGGTGDPVEKLEKAFNEVATVKEAGEKERLLKIKELIGYTEKRGMSSKWASDNKAVFVEAIASLNGVGIFIVPNGTLESWAPEVEPKVRFAELAPDVIRADAGLSSIFKEFAKLLLKHLEIEIA